MPEQSKEKPATNPKPKKILPILLLAVVLIASAAILLRPPRRSAEAFCAAYAKENSKLPKPSNFQERKYGVAGLTSSTSDPHNFANIFARLEKVAPDDIRPDVRALQLVFEKIEDDPSQELSAGLGGLSS